MIPGNETRLELSFSEDVKEWTKAHYKCKNGTKIPDDFDVADLVDGNFTVPCGSGGKYPVCINIGFPNGPVFRYGNFFNMMCRMV